MKVARNLLDYRSRPHTTCLDFSNVPLSKVTDAYNKYANHAGLVSPEHEAVSFYMLNAAVAELQQKVEKHQTLTADQTRILDLYYTFLETIGRRVYFYMLAIGTRESRYCTSNPKMVSACEPFGVMPFWKSIQGVDEYVALQRLLDTPPDVSALNYGEHMVNAFEFGGHATHYAGPAWAAVMRPLRDFFAGKITMEMLVDTAWTLAHNTAPIFNKGFLFKHQKEANLNRILDVQRAGMIPQLVSTGGLSEHAALVTDEHTALLGSIRAVLPEFGNGAVDYQKVQALGSKGTYVTPKKTFKPKTKVSPQKPEPQKPEPVNQNLVHITPNDTVLKITRKEMKAL